MKPTQRWCQTISLILIAIGCLHVIYFQPHRQLLVRLRPVPVQSDVTAGAQDVTVGAHDVTAGAHDVTAGAHDVTAGTHDVTSGEHDVTAGSHDVTTDVTSRNVSVTSRPRLVVIVSNPRSGSSFLGELLSSPADAMYLYEPLRYLQLIGHNVGKTAHLSPNPAQRNFVQEELLRLLNCQFEHDEMFNKSLKYMIWNKPDLGEHVTTEQRRAVCLDLNYRVIKVIRPSLAAVLPLLELPEYDIHVVHLVRDPRAIVNSLRLMESWYKTLPPEKICQAYAEDLNGSKDIDSKRMIRVRYEDLVGDITKEARRLFKFIGQPMTSDVEFFIRRHTQTPKDPPPSSLPVSVSQLYSLG